MSNNEKSNTNGRWVIKLLVGALWATIFVALTTIGGYTVTNDQGSRDRDTAIKEEQIKTERRISTQLAELKEGQNKQFTEILIAIERLKVRSERNNP